MPQDRVLPCQQNLSCHIATAQESANVFCKGPDRKYFRCCRPGISVIALTTQLCYFSTKAARGNRVNRLMAVMQLALP